MGPPAQKRDRVVRGFASSVQAPAAKPQPLPPLAQAKGKPSFLKKIQ